MTNWPDAPRGIIREDTVTDAFTHLVNYHHNLPLSYRWVIGYVTASLMVQKLQSYAQQNALAQALQEYGRLIEKKPIYTARSRQGRHMLSRQLMRQKRPPGSCG
jgi:hypothetical protein